MLRPLPRDDMAGDLTSAVLGDPFERAAYRTRQGAKPEGGRKEGAFTELVSDPVRMGRAAFGMTPPGALLNMYEAGREGDYGNMAANAVYGGLGGALMRAGKGALTAFPRLTGGAAGTAAALTAADAGDRSPKSTEWWRSQREAPPTIDPFSAPQLTEDERRQYTQPEFAFKVTPPNFEGLGPMARKEAQASYDRRLATAPQDELAAREAYNARQERMDLAAQEALARKAKGPRADYEAEVAHKQAIYEAEQARLDAEDQKFRLANQSTREAHPLAAPMMQGAGVLTAAAFPLLTRNRIRGTNNAINQQLKDAMTAGDAELAAKAAGTGSPMMQKVSAERLKAAAGPQGVGRMRDTELSPAAQAAWATGGALEGAAGATVPYIVDRETLPAESHGREESGDLANWLQMAAYGAIPGAISGALGARVPMSRGAVPDIPRATGLMKGLTARAPTAKKPEATEKTAPKLRKRRVSNEDTQ